MLFPFYLIQVSGKWSHPFSSKSCVPVICEKPLPIINGLVEGKSYNYGDVISYTCLPGFELQVQYFYPLIFHIACPM